ncbi:MAG: hypothetical protein HQL58_10015 [Magnetococcales bacterium]|nr:hypothetical protein [Magnetococcales bacterium]
MTDDYFSSRVVDCKVMVSRSHLTEMIQLVRLLDRLSRNPAYQACLAADLPEVARFDPHHDGVMMGYDFHLTPDGPRLIEVNTNAGGALLAWRCHDPTFMTDGGSRFDRRNRWQQRVVNTFACEMGAFLGQSPTWPQRLVILDDQPEQQFLFPEMVALVDIFRQLGVTAIVADPSQLVMDGRGVYHEGDRIDLIYNRHCDFYLAEPALQGLQSAYRARQICLTPNPHVYGLLADKRRMVLWSSPAQMSQLGLSATDLDRLARMIPTTRYLCDKDPQQLWADRRHWVLKPATGAGSRGVLLGQSLSRKRLVTLDPDTTLVQQMVLPSRTPCSPDDPDGMKSDLRLFAYRHQILGIAARLYRGQVTNLRQDGGFAPVQVTHQDV